MLFLCPVPGVVSINKHNKVSRHWTGKQIAQPKAGKYPSSSSDFSPYNCCLRVVLKLEKGD